MKSIIFIVALFWCFPPGLVMGEVVRGIYGVPSIAGKDPLSYVAQMERAGVNAVFVPPDRDTVGWFKARGFQVYVSVNAFGGKGAWNRYPDARPVMADGSLLGSEEGYQGHGGVCPTHEGWRQDRLNHIERLLADLGGEEGIDGIWLDSIRYPGQWEIPAPEIPDTCYCGRCLARFQEDTGIRMSADLGAKGASRWIKRNCAYDWMEWKKEQIASFVRDVRQVLDQRPEAVRPILGLFLVPWTKGERGNDVSYLLAQDPFQLSELADVISPMAYHRMCGRSPAWVGYMTRYYREMAKARVWPIVEAQPSKRNAQREKGCPLSVIGYQSEEKRTGELEKVARFAAEGGADGVLVYSFRGIEDAWSSLKTFSVLQNYIGNATPVRNSKSGPSPADLEEQNGKPTSHIPHRTSHIALKAGDEWGSEWLTPLDPCEPGAEYVFRAEFWRDGWRNGVYPAVSLWGHECLVDTHLKAREWQPLRVNMVCPDEVKDPNFRFINRDRDTTFRLRHPALERDYRFGPEPAIPVAEGFFPGPFFPIGVYGAGLENLAQIKRLAVNTVVLGGSGDDLMRKVAKCHEVGLRYVLSVPRDPDRLPVYLDEISAYVRPYDTAFYVNDEPGIWSFPINRAEDVHRLIKDRFPGCATCMAVVRPRVCGDYAQAADFFMLDQYPMPYMPMTWLSDCMGECAGGLVNGYSLLVNRVKTKREKLETQSSKLEPQREAQTAKDMAQSGADESSSHAIIPSSTKRLASVVQAFGGERWKDVGWPRLPTWQEMDCLAFLSVVHGARAVFFYTFSEIGRTDEGREALGRVVGRLNRIYPWLVTQNSDERVVAEMVSENRWDPKGRPAVQGCLKRKENGALLIAVNTIGTCVEALVGAEELEAAREIFSDEDYAVKDGRLRARFGPYETKAFVFAERPKGN